MLRRHRVPEVIHQIARKQHAQNPGSYEVRGHRRPRFQQQQDTLRDVPVRIGVAVATFRQTLAFQALDEPVPVSRPISGSGEATRSTRIAFPLLRERDRVCSSRRTPLESFGDDDLPHATWRPPSAARSRPFPSPAS